MGANDGRRRGDVPSALRGDPAPLAAAGALTAPHTQRRPDAVARLAEQRPVVAAQPRAFELDPELPQHHAAEHGQDVPEELIEELRSDALQIRMAVMMALVKYGFSHSGVAASVNAHRAATAYSAMLAHITTLFQEHSALYFPRFLEAM